MVRGGSFHPLRGLLSRSKGAVAVETAIVLPLLLVVLIGFIDVGRLFFAHLTLKQATVEMSRVLSYGADRDNQFVIFDMADSLAKPALILAKGSRQYRLGLNFRRCPEGVPVDGTREATVTMNWEFHWYTPLGLIAAGEGISSGDSTFTSESVSVCQL